MKYIYIITLFSITLSCTEPTTKTEAEDVELINFRVNRDLKLSEFIDSIEYNILPKEIKYGYFDKILLTENNFIIADFEMSMNIYILDKQFNLISIINKYGEGPGEYQWIENINYNIERETIEVLTNKDILRYSISGAFIESIKLPFSFGNFSSISRDKYIIYNNNLTTDYPESTYMFAIWDSKTNNLEPLVKHIKNDLVSSHLDRSNIFRYEDEVFASHIFLDTLYKINTNKKISKFHININNQNLPYEYVKFDTESGHESILDKSEVMSNYAFHYPKLMANKEFLIDGYIKNNTIYFYLLNRINRDIFTGINIINDIDGGLNYLNPRILDNSNNIYTFHEYEELKEKANINIDKKLIFNEYIKSLGPETGFVVAKYHIKNL
ncbi:6-bladed beta-propeller [Algoriphagus antarcticus]|uniref:6-bladed beta-propeller protein n=1 Tax=Algoriphagus antarcticus TaxID=238540 RepID=A0A3E0D7E9_9BACT|nr:6-bladed beta-propeller [Algoriphagus antarcticus]REG78474.1 6-bladed beta-propeller protein [Algoriphagus antarcticus]